MSDIATAERRAASKSSDRWFQKPGGSPTDRLPAFRHALAEVARAWQSRFISLAAAEGEITFTGMTVCKADDVAGRRSTAAVLAVLQAPGWKTRIGVHFDRVFVTTVVEALFGGGGDELQTAAQAPLSPVDVQIVELIVRQVADALAVGFAKCLPSMFVPDGVQAKLDPSFLGKPSAPVVVGTLSLNTLGNAVELDVLVPLAAMMAFADELSAPAEDGEGYEDPRWTQRLEQEISQASMRLQACVDLAPMEVGVIATLAVGQFIELPTGATGNVRLQCAGDDLFCCELGQSAGFYTVRIDEVVDAVTALALDAAPAEAMHPSRAPSASGMSEPFAMPFALPDLDL